MSLSTPAAGAQRGADLIAPATADAWLLEALRDSRKQAQTLADLAYEAWSTAPSAIRYASYRAAQDRADALVVDLAALVHALDPERQPQ